jgi:hypothetical protein
MQEADMPIQNPLTAVMEIKAGTSNYDPEMELKKLLIAKQDLIFGAIQKLGFLHFARFVFLDTSTPKYFVIITSYDFDFDDYINIFIDELGELFNQMLKHIEQDIVKPPIDVRQQRRQFIEYVKNIDQTNPDIIQRSMNPDPKARMLTIQNLTSTNLTSRNPKTQDPKNQVAFFYSAYPDLSVQQIWKMQEERYD